MTYQLMKAIWTFEFVGFLYLLQEFDSNSFECLL
jgi:hypothetical protein